MKDKDTKVLEEMYKHINVVNEEAQIDQDSEQLSPEQLQDLTDKLHEAFCHENHTDGCGYYYGNWNTDIRLSVNYARGKWLNRTSAAVKKYGYKNLIGPASKHHEAYKQTNQSLKELRSIMEDDM